MGVAAPEHFRQNLTGRRGGVVDVSSIGDLGHLSVNPTSDDDLLLADVEGAGVVLEDHFGRDNFASHLLSRRIEPYDLLLILLVNTKDVKIVH